MRTMNPVFGGIYLQYTHLSLAAYPLSSIHTVNVAIVYMQHTDSLFGLILITGCFQINGVRKRDLVGILFCCM